MNFKNAHLWIMGVAVLSLLAVGCTSASESTTAEGGADLSPIQDEIDQILTSASDYQRDLMAGGVTRNEYELAAAQMQSCAEKVGHSGTLDVTGEFVQFDLDDSEGAVVAGILGDVPEEVQDCYTEYLEAVELTYVSTSVDSVANLQNEEELFYQCLRSKGYPIPDNPSGNPDTSAVVETAEYDEMLECWEVAGV